MGRFFVPLVGVALLCLLAGGHCRRPSPGEGAGAGAGAGGNAAAPATIVAVHKGKEEDEALAGMSATGSSLPDCAHACGPCSPCRRVMVSFECSVAESCPIVYRCMCRGRYYQVPSN